MRVLVTGARGQLGQALLGMSPPSCTAQGYGHAQLDISDPDAVRSLLQQERPDVLVNAAAYTAVDQAESEPELAHAVNALAPAALAAGCHEVGARFIHVSTDFVFDGTASRPYAPDAPTNPLSVYGRSKRDGEQAVREASAGQATILRTAWVYGPGGKNFVGTMRRLLSERERVAVVADQIGTPTSTHSLARAIYHLIDTGEGVGETRHWTDAGVASWYDFACAVRVRLLADDPVAQYASIDPIQTKDFPAAAARPHYSVLDCTVWSPKLLRRHWQAELATVWPQLSD